MGEVFSADHPIEFRSRLYLLLRDLWLSARINYLGGLKKRKPPEGHKNIQNSITDQIRDSMGTFEVFCAGKKEATQNLRRGVKESRMGTFPLYQVTGGFL